MARNWLDSLTVAVVLLSSPFGRPASAQDAATDDVPAALAQNADEDDRRETEASRPALGVRFIRGNDVLLIDVVPGSPAARAGLQVGDVVLGLDGQRVASTDLFIDMIARLETGSTGTLDVERNGVVDTVEIDLTGWDSVFETPHTTLDPADAAKLPRFASFLDDAAEDPDAAAEATDDATSPAGTPCCNAGLAYGYYPAYGYYYPSWTYVTWYYPRAYYSPGWYGYAGGCCSGAAYPYYYYGSPVYASPYYLYSPVYTSAYYASPGYAGPLAFWPANVGWATPVVSPSGVLLGAH